MVKDHSDSEKGNRCCHIGYSFRLAARVLLYAPSHRQDSTNHGLCCTSRGALAETRNSSIIIIIIFYHYFIFKIKQHVYQFLTKQQNAFRVVALPIRVAIFGDFVHIHTYNIYSNIKYIHTYIRTYVHTYIHTCIHVCMHAYIHTYMHTIYIQI